MRKLCRNGVMEKNELGPAGGKEGILLEGNTGRRGAIGHIPRMESDYAPLVQNAPITSGVFR